MFKKLLSLILALSMILSLAGCSIIRGRIRENASEKTSTNKTSSSGQNTDVSSKLYAVILANAKAFESEDMDELLLTEIVPSEQLAQFKSQMNNIFKNYDLKYTIENFKVISTDPNDAQVEVTQLTQRISGGEFRDNRVVAVHHLKLVNGVWKIFKSDSKDIQYLTQSAQKPTADISAQLISVIQENMKACQNEDLNRYLATMSIAAAQLETYKKSTLELFNTYNLRYTLEDYEVLSTDENDAQVEVIQLTQKISGPDFNDNRVDAIHHLKKFNGVWKIFKTDIKDTEYLPK